MWLFLLPLALLLLGDDVYGDIHRADRTFPFRPSPYYERVHRSKAVQDAMRMKIGSHLVSPLDSEMRRSAVLILFKTWPIPSRSPTIPPVSPPSHMADSDYSGLGQGHATSVGHQNFSPPTSGHNHPPSTSNQDHTPSRHDQVPTTSTVHETPTNTFNQHPHSSSFDEQHKSSGFPQVTETPSFKPTHEPSSFQDSKPPSFKDDQKPFNPDENHRQSSFGQDEKSLDKDGEAPFPHTLGSHPDRNPVCNILPDPGTCRAALPRYYLDPETGTCNCFLYGGCREHGQDESPNSFLTLEACQQECHPPKMEEGSYCKEIFKEDTFISYAVEPQAQKTSTDHLGDDEYLSSILQ